LLLNSPATTEIYTLSLHDALPILTKKVTYLSAQRDLAQARGNLFDVRNRVTRAEASIREASGRILEIEQRLRNEAFTQMGAVSSEQAQVQAQVGLLEDRLERTSITAPITGRVSALLERSPGGVIGPGEILMEIVPTEQELIAEIRISPRDIGHLEEGLEVLVKVEPYNYAGYGGIKGILTNLSAASYKDAEENTFFTAEVVLERNYVGMDPRSNQIRPRHDFDRRH